MVFESVTKKDFITVLSEGFIVGLLTILIVNILKNHIHHIPNFSGEPEKYELYLLTGALFHIICEYVGFNMWYAKSYCSLINDQEKKLV